MVTKGEPNPFLQDAVIITTYEFVTYNEEKAKAVPWDLTVFEEANALSAVHQDGNQQAKALKCIAGSSFKLLLTGTSIEKNIMDLYGLIWFIDETIPPYNTGNDFVYADDFADPLARYRRSQPRPPNLTWRLWGGFIRIG